MADNVAQKVIWKLADNMGKIGSLSFFIATDLSVDPLTTAATGIATFNTISDAVIVGQVSQTANDVASGTAASNSYDIRDKLLVECEGSQNEKVRIEIGDLDPAILQTGSELVDPTNAAWLALKTAITTNAKDKLGNALSVIRAYRQRSRHLKSGMRFI
jgi:hypothetical protein